MNKLKLILTITLTFVVLFAQVGSAAAAPLAQTPTDITGTVQTITIGTTNGVTTVTVTLKDAQGVLQTVTISEATANSLLLLKADGTAIVLDPNNPLSITIAAGDIISVTTN